MVAVKTPSFSKAKVLKTRLQSFHNLRSKVMCKADAKLPASVSSPNFLDSKKETAKPQLEAASNPNMRSLLSLTWQNDAAACLDSLLGDTRSSVRLRVRASRVRSALSRSQGGSELSAPLPPTPGHRPTPRVPPSRVALTRRTLPLFTVLLRQDVCRHGRAVTRNGRRVDEGPR
mmetsp:Transcript_108348/g.314980  ORF Transcript_108348/g.314980 Transcript_108348/m.314980 type:complete len:174 (+) Transcript_108348:257-778(+)